MTYHRFIPWFLAALVAALLGVAGAAVHLITTSATGDSSRISATDLPVDGRPVIAWTFRSKLAPRGGPAERSARVTPPAGDVHLVVASPLVSPTGAVPLTGPPGSASVPSLAAAAEAVAVAAKATRAGAERARRMLQDATVLAQRDAAGAAAAGEHASARRAAADAVALALAAERADTVAAVAAVAEGVAQRVAEHPERYRVRDLPALPEPFCFSVLRETGQLAAEAKPGGLSAAWLVTNAGASLCSSTARN